MNATTNKEPTMTTAKSAVSSREEIYRARFNREQAEKATRDAVNQHAALRQMRAFVMKRSA